MISTEIPTTECWLPVPGFGGWYDVSDHGRVRSWIVHARDCKGRFTRRCRAIHPRILRVSIGSSGYACLALFVGGHCRALRIHRLVLCAFVGPRPQGACTRHLDGNPANNYLGNLCYGTPKENVADTIRHGRYRAQRGVEKPQHRLTEMQVVEIRTRAAAGENPNRLAKEFGLSAPPVYNLVYGKTWKHVGGPRSPTASWHRTKRNYAAATEDKLVLENLPVGCK